MTEISDDAKRNREDWTQANADYTDAKASATWAAEEITWGVFGVPEAPLGTLGDVDGLDVVELGCGTAYVSAWLAKRGARPVGVDVTPAQLATARRCQAEFGIEFPLDRGERRGRAAALGELRPRRLRVRRQHLVRPAPLDPRGAPAAPARRAALVPPQQHALDPLRSRRGRRRPSRCCGRSVGSAGSSGRASSASSGSCRTASSSGSCRGTGFDVVDLVELYAPDDAVDHAYYDTFSAEWARKWPAEEIWVAKKR